MSMKNPVHPGKIIKSQCIEPVGLSVTQAAKALGVNRSGLYRILGGETAVTANLAVRLEKLGWATSEVWMRMQMQYDLAQARKDRTIKVDRRHLPRGHTGGVAQPVV